jgi:hypothetical protein
MLPGIAAYCDPSFRGDLGCAVLASSPEIHMFKRNAKFASTVFAGFLAATSFTTVSHGADGAADDCLSGPKDHTPGGGHWYYRIDRATKRHCWYLREGDEKLSQTVAPNSSPSAKPVAPKPAVTMQPAVADARAELTSRTAVEAPSPAQAPFPAMPAETAQTQPSLVASRWPDPFSTPPSADETPARRDADQNTNAVQAQPAQPASVLSAPPFAAADAALASPADSVRMQVAALAAALALAGIVGAVVFRIAGARRPAKTKIRRDRGAIWPPTDDDRIQLSAHPEADALPRRRVFARDLDRARNYNDRTAEFFAELSKRTPT